jgi:hypothetical protein
MDTLQQLIRILAKSSSFLFVCKDISLLSEQEIVHNTSCLVLAPFQDDRVGTYSLQSAKNTSDKLIGILLIACFLMS